MENAVQHRLLKCLHVAGYTKLDKCVFFKVFFQGGENLNVGRKTGGELSSSAALRPRPEQDCPLPLHSIHVTLTLHFLQVLRYKAI